MIDKELRKLHDPKEGRLMVAGLMSGGGSNLVKIIEHELDLEGQLGASPYHVALIFSDNPCSNACLIGQQYGIPVLISDIKQFYAARGKPLKDLETRALYDQETAVALSRLRIKAIAYAGYMRIVTKPLIDTFLGINVHPGDLTVLTEGNRRKYTGDHAVRDAIMACDRYLRSTTHIVSEEVDGGQILMLSAPVQVVYKGKEGSMAASAADSIAQYNQDRLKEAGDWIIFPMTLEYIADGRYAKDDLGVMHFDGNPCPRGMKLLPYGGLRALR